MKKLTYILVFSLLVIYGCKDNNDYAEEPRGDYSYTEVYSDDSKSDIVEEKYYAGDDDVVQQTPTSTTPSDDRTSTSSITKEELKEIGRKIIKNADVSIELEDYKKGVSRIKDSLMAFDCIISSETENNYDTYISSVIVIRVKSSQFDSLLNAILIGDEKIISKNIYINDVTQEYVDVYQRLKNKKSVEKQYLELLKKANTINEILSVQQYLRQIQEEIESSEGMLLFWDNQSSYSTVRLTITYHGDDVVVSGSTFGERLADDFGLGWKGVLFLIEAIITLWPLWILLGIIIFVVRRQIKNKKASEQNKKIND